jgi:hypothetical protein
MIDSRTLSLINRQQAVIEAQAQLIENLEAQLAATQGQVTTLDTQMAILQPVAITTVPGP